MISIMSEFPTGNHYALSDKQRRLIDGFCESEKPKSPQELAVVDQASSELRDQLESMGLRIETEEQFHVACIVAIATSVNMRKLIEAGHPATAAEAVTAKTIAAIRPVQH